MSWSARVRPSRINHVSLRVRDLRRSADFYCSLLGMEMRPATPPGDSVCVCAVPSASSENTFGIALVQGLPRGTEPFGMDHVSLQVDAARDVDEIYGAAVAQGYGATEPRFFGGYYQTFLFDPDGYKIEILAEQSVLDAQMIAARIASNNGNGAVYDRLGGLDRAVVASVEARESSVS